MLKIVRATERDAARCAHSIRALPVTLALFCLLSMGCGAQTPRTCDEFTSQPLRALLQQTMSASEMRVRIANIYGWPVEKIDMYINGEQAYFSWMDNAIIGDFHMMGEVPIGANVSYQGMNIPLLGRRYTIAPPSVDNLIVCLGQPSAYIARLGPGDPRAAKYVQDLTLFFPKSGVLAYTFEWTNNPEPRPVNGHIIMEMLSFAPITSPDDAASTFADWLRPEVREQMKPWPGTLDQVRVDIDPEISRQH